MSQSVAVARKTAEIIHNSGLCRAEYANTAEVLFEGLRREAVFEQAYTFARRLCADLNNINAAEVALDGDQGDFPKKVSEMVMYTRLRKILYENLDFICDNDKTVA